MTDLEQANALKIEMITIKAGATDDPDKLGSLLIDTLDPAGLLYTVQMGVIDKIVNKCYEHAEEIEALKRKVKNLETNNSILAGLADENEELEQSEYDKIMGAK